MLKENQPSLKKAQSEVKKAVRTLTKDEYSELHNLVILPLEQAVDNQLNNDKLFFDISQNLISMFGLTPKYDIYILFRDETQKAILQSKKITSDTFKNHYWKYVREFLTGTDGFVFPKSESVDAIKKQAQREKAKELTGQDGKLYNLAQVSDEQLESGFFGTKGKKAYLDRIDAKEKDSVKKQKQTISTFKEKFVPKMRELASTEYDFAMWIDTNLNNLREQFKKQK